MAARSRSSECPVKHDVKGTDTIPSVKNSAGTSGDGCPMSNSNQVDPRNMVT